MEITSTTRKIVFRFFLLIDTYFFTVLFTSFQIKVIGYQATSLKTNKKYGDLPSKVV